MVGRAIKSPVGGITLTLFQAASSFILEASLSLEHHISLLVYCLSPPQDIQPMRTRTVSILFTTVNLKGNRVIGLW